MNQVDETSGEMFAGIDGKLQRLIFQSYMSRADKVVVLLDGGLKVRAINEYGLLVLKLERETVVGRPWLAEFVDAEARDTLREDYEELQRTGTSKPAKNECRLRVGEGKTGMFAWQHFLVKGKLGKVEAILSVGEDVEEQKETERVLARRNAILEALSLAADKFLLATPDVWEGNVLQVLEHVGEARGSERVYVCKNRRLADGRMGMFLKYEWKQDGEASVFRGREVGFKAYEDIGLKRWMELFLKGETICEVVAAMPKEEQKWNFSVGAKSVVVVPVFVGKVWWGYIAFEDWAADRECAPSEIEALKAVALTFGQAIRRKRIEEALTLEKQGVEMKVAERTAELEATQQAVQEGLWKQQEEKARLTASIHSLSMGFVATDTEKKILLINHAVNDILGKEEAGWTWERLRERLQGVVDIDDVYERCLANTEEMVKGDLKYGEKYLRIYLTPVKLVEGDGRVIGVVILVEDVTEEKQLQVARDEFFAVASHELRTPLSSIKGNASVIEDYFRDRVNDDQLMGIVKDIYDSSEKLIDIVNEYLDISRAEVGRLELTKKEFEVVEVLRQVMKELEYAAVSRGLAFELQVDEGFVAMVAADRDRTRQVLFNLLGNALKYTKTGGVYVKVVVDGWVRVKVYDTGQGVAMDEQGNLFGKFRQFGNKVYMQDVTEGTGMGLYISKLISEAMGGRVYLETSEVGKGSCFVLELERG